MEVLELKNTITEIRNTIDKLKSKLDINIASNKAYRIKRKNISQS